MKKHNSGAFTTCRTFDGKAVVMLDFHLHRMVHSHDPGSSLFTFFSLFCSSLALCLVKGIDFVIREQTQRG